jgi:protein-tyrosine phosphatase
VIRLAPKWPPTGFVDLHCHYLPGIDDGVRTFEEGVALCRGLASIGYSFVVATPHIRTAMFENRRTGILTAMKDFESKSDTVDGMPALGVGAEHFFDDVFWGLFLAKDFVPYPGKSAALVEFPTDGFPIGIDRRFFEMRVRGIRPVIAHPERYAPLFRASDPIDPLLDAGGLPLLDLMSLVDRYGTQPRLAAERMLEEGVYYAACSDCHRPEDVSKVAEAIGRLRELVGDEETDELLSTHPRRILDGVADE